MSELIDKLSSDLKAVKPLSVTKSAVKFWSALTLVVFLLAAVFFRIRAIDTSVDVNTLIALISSLIIALVAAIYLSLLRLPGRISAQRARKLLYFTFATILFGLGGGLLAANSGEAVGVSDGAHCATSVTLISVVSFFAAFAFLRVGAPTQLTLAGLLSGVFAATTGSAAILISCENSAFSHLLLSHSIVPIAGMGLLGIVAARLALAWKSKEEIMNKLILALSLVLGFASSGSAQAAESKTDTAVFGGGCFWCMEGPFDNTPGVIDVTSGYSGGESPNPTYKQVSAGGTQHVEVIQVTFDPSKVSYEKLLETYWRQVDPTDSGGQFCDRGNQYRSVIYAREEQRKAAEASKAETQKKLNKPIVTMVEPAKTFYKAEDYHQDYSKKNPIRYKFYRSRCGRDDTLKKIWGNVAH